MMQESVNKMIQFEEKNGYIVEKKENSFKNKLIIIKSFILKQVYNILKAFISCNEISSKDYNVSICAIFKNESKYLKEWIEYHRIVGVEHFYLFNNNSTDDFEPVLKPYVDEGLVTIENWEKNQAQMECYAHCVKLYGCKTKWMGFIDIDEFVVPIDYNNIYDFLKKFEKKAGAVKIYWKMFGTAGLIGRDLDALVTESFNVAWSKYYSVGKCFYNTNFEFDYNLKKNRQLHHFCWTKYGKISLPPVDVFNKINLNCVPQRSLKQHPIQINHYFTKSFQEYSEKKNKGDVYFKTNPHDLDYFFAHESICSDVDCSVYKYLIKLKMSMRGDK